MGFHLGFLKIYLGFLEANLGFLSVVWGLSRINVQNPELTLDHKPPLICRTHKHEGIFRAFAQFLRAINKASARLLGGLSTFFGAYCQFYCQFLLLPSVFDNNFRQWSDICRAIIPVNMDKTGKWPDTLSTSRQQFSTTEIRRKYDGTTTDRSCILHFAFMCYVS